MIECCSTAVSHESDDNDDADSLPGGKALGGSSTTNGLFYGRGSASVWDRWVELGNPGWGWDDVYPLAIKVNILRHSLKDADEPVNAFQSTNRES
jgi:choline dehydrogenase-like flavoprotein